MMNYDECCTKYDNVRFAEGADVMACIVKGILRMDPSKVYMFKES